MEMKNKWKANHWRALLIRMLTVIAVWGIREIGGEAGAVDVESAIHDPKSEIVLPGTPEWDSGFDGQKAWQHVVVLASDSLRGRNSGFAGADKADAYITDYFQQLGLAESFGGDGYRQNFTYGAGEYRMPSSLLFRFPDGRLDTAFMWQEFNIFKYSGFGKAKGRLIFVGYGISAPEKGWDDYAGLDVKGAVVLAMRGGPELPGVKWENELYNGFKATTALNKGAVGFMATENDPPKLATIMQEYFHEQLPAVWISKTLADTLLKSTGKTKDEWKKEIDSTKHPHSLPTDVEIEYQVSGDYYPKRETCNIAGLIEGSDPELKREVVIIGAHMDHHGADAAGNIYHGADDNASGTATMMEVARVFAESPVKHKRTLMFMGFAGEEEGLVGSNYFVNHLPLKDYEVVAMLNMDMVGQGNCSLWVGGIADYPVLGESLFADWPDSVLKALEFGGLYEGSDHYPFGEAGINAYVVGVKGDHPNYHTPLDVAANIKPECLKAAGDMMYRCAAALADYPEALKTRVGKTEHLVRVNGGLEIAGLHIEDLPSAFPAVSGRVEGVEYPAVTKVVGLYPPGSGTFFPDLILAGTESARKMAESEGLPYMVDSTLRDWKGRQFAGIAAALQIAKLPENRTVGESVDQLKAFTRLGVGFVTFGILSDDYLQREGRSGYIQYQPESAAMWRKAGIRALVFQVYSEREVPRSLLEVARVWGNQMILKSREEPTLIGAAELANAGVFVIVSKIGDAARFKEILADPKCSKMIGIMPDTALVNTLLEAGVEDGQIGDLLSGNLRATLQRWWADSTYTQVELPKAND